MEIEELPSGGQKVKSNNSNKPVKEKISKIDCFIARLSLILFHQTDV